MPPPDLSIKVNSTLSSTSSTTKLQGIFFPLSKPAPLIARTPSPQFPPRFSQEAVSYTISTWYLMNSSRARIPSHQYIQENPTNPSPEFPQSFRLPLSPLLRRITFRRPSMDSRDFRLQSRINKPMPRERVLLFELSGYDYRLE